MSSVRILALAGAAATMSTAAFAADFPPVLPPVQPVLQVPAQSGWDLRGDVGVSVQRFRAFDHFQTNPNFVWPATCQLLQKHTDVSSFSDFGFAYQVNRWRRFKF